MKIACTADWHVFNYQDFSKTYMTNWNNKSGRYEIVPGEEVETETCKPMNSRLFNILNGLCDMRDYCLDNDIKVLLISGDIFHKRETIEVTVYNPTYRVLQSMTDSGMKVYATAGNHDDVDNSQLPLTSLHPLKEIIYVIEKPTKVVLEENDDLVEIVSLPYSKDKKFVLDSMKRLREKCENPRDAILMCHLGITGGLVGSGQYSMKDEYSLKELMYDKWKYLVAGHYHQPQLLEYNSIYTGSPLQNNFGDELKGDNGYNGFFVLDTSKRWDIRFIPIVAPRFMTLSPEDICVTSPEVFLNNYIRIKSSAKNSESIKDDLQSALAENDLESLNLRLELEKEYNTEQRSDIGVSNTFEETIQIYAQERYTGEQDMSKVIDIGLEILQEVSVGGGDK